ncbi:MAG: hypothetical protein JNL21_12785 [Myxococcales bacterium]|nr:hypothetical protein [Myxococcales bacterium]
MRFVLLVVICLLGWVNVASAFELRDAPGGLTMRVEPAGGEKLCVAWPKGNVDPVGCDGFDVSAFEKIGSTAQPPFQPVFAAVLRRETSMMLILVQRDESGGFKPDSAKEYMNGLLDGLTEQSGGTVAKKSYRIVRIADREAVEIDAAMSLPDGSPLSLLFATQKHLVLGAGRVSYTMTFSSAKEEATWLEAVTSRAKSTIEADPVKASRSTTDDEDVPRKRSNDTAFEAGRMVGRVVGIVAVVAFFVWLARTLTKKKTPQQYPPPGYWNGGQGPYPPQYPQGPHPPQYPQGPYPPPYPQGPYPPPYQGPHSPQQAQQPQTGGVGQPGAPPQPYAPPPNGRTPPSREGGGPGG